ncbi:MAG TPA: galactose-1-phosphate uridylyltransferase, partial [Spirochaetia bacterium]|nr:galactose-1-phosphate uridylyltransferase [Spirochaetia bacterium]
MGLTDYPHRRLNILTGDWVLVSSHRTERPWQGKVERQETTPPPAYDPHCYLCPGNKRASGEVNPQYDHTLVFTNDFSALLPEIPEEVRNTDSLLVAESERGVCRVLCYSPRHDLTLPLMTHAEIERVVALWIEQYREIGSLPYIRNVQIFENRGPLMGCSNAHPHGQIWADETIPVTVAREGARQEEHYAAKKQCLLCRYLEREETEGERIVLRN